MVVIPGHATVLTGRLEAAGGTARPRAQPRRPSWRHRGLHVFRMCPRSPALGLAGGSWKRLPPGTVPAEERSAALTAAEGYGRTVAPGAS
jgi:hypothetical protein